ncbi:TPA: AraC family ligand binding domain-containing protein [Klebsiella pneumoniae]
MHKTFTLNHTDNIELNLYQYGEEICHKGHSYGPAVRQHYLFHYVISGTGTFFNDFGAFHVVGGEGFLIHPHEVTTYCADNKDPWHYMWLEVDGLIAARIFEECHLSRQFPVYRPRLNKDNSSTHCYLQQIIEHGDELPLKVQGLCYLFFSSLISNTQGEKASLHDDKTRHLQKAVKRIENRYHEHLTVDGLAAYCNINRSYLCRLFISAFGMGPREYLLNFRMSIAVSLLKNSHTAIKVVSISVGYENQLQFSKAFKKVHGISPTKWREVNLGDNR